VRRQRRPGEERRGEEEREKVRGVERGES